MQHGVISLGFLSVFPGAYSARRIQSRKSFPAHFSVVKYTVEWPNLEKRTLVLTGRGFRLKSP